MFNPEEFMNTTTEGEFSTQRELVESGEYSAIVEQLEAKTVGDRNLPIISVRYKLINTGQEGLDGRIIFDTIWLDVDDAGNLMRGPGKNIRLGQLLEAVGMNGKAWSPGQLQGQPVLVAVGQRQNKRSGEMENTISKVAMAA